MEGHMVKRKKEVTKFVNNFRLQIVTVQSYELEIQTEIGAIVIWQILVAPLKGRGPVFFWRNSGKSRFPPKLKQQEQAILKAINSFGVQICIKIALFNLFSAGLDIRTNFFPFLNFGEFQISSKKSFITSTTVREGRDNNDEDVFHAFAVPH